MDKKIIPHQKSAKILIFADFYIYSSVDFSAHAIKGACIKSLANL